jgi:hypothetical protein
MIVMIENHFFLKKMKELFTETSQYRNWFYSKEKLQEIREKNHESAVERVKQRVLEEAVSENIIVYFILSKLFMIFP